MDNLGDSLSRMVAKFSLRAELNDEDRSALLALPFRVRTMEAHQYIVREGMLTTVSCLLLSGFAYRHKVLPDGSRQICSVHIAGDFVDLEGSLLRQSDCNVQALARCEIAFVPNEAVNQIIASRPSVARAMWIDTLIDGSIYREWIANVGRRDARTRIAHLFCEFARRLEVAGVSQPGGYELPMTQEQLADATGLTAVHVNRTLKGLDAEGLIVREKRFIRIPDWHRLRQVAGFNELYLHLDQLAA